eukprot:Transcript_26949.p5 GENE.Transcript_26949~~Transcript_26949.p5  ORF type:complete len:111 (-),score=19.70 Transcript_26949:32-364(-)
MVQQPLQFALEHEASEAVVLALLAAHPDSAKEKWLSKLPLHLAFKHRASEAVVRALLAAYPLAVLKSSNGKMPLELALETGATRELLASLAQTQMQTLALLADPTKHVDL